jgi:hypothetical protein
LHTMCTMVQYYIQPALMHILTTLKARNFGTMVYGLSKYNLESRGFVTGRMQFVTQYTPGSITSITA